VHGSAPKGFVHSAARAIAAQAKPAYIYYFGDWDPSGVVIGKDVERKFARYAPDAEIYFERIAITPDQIEQYQLPTRPTKQHKNTHAKNFKGDSTELDALPAEVLRDLVREVIERHIDQRQLEITQVVEESEREAWDVFRNLKQKPPDDDPDENQ
jgi:hypothetical protein